MKEELENVRLGFRFDFLRYINFVTYALKREFLSSHYVSGINLGFTGLIT